MNIRKLREAARKYVDLLHHPLSLHNFVMSLEDGFRIADIGCGNSSPSRILSIRANLLVSGVDVEEVSDRHILESFVLSSGEDFPDSILRLGPVDAVISNHNLEHVFDRKATFKAMASILKPGGRMFIATPSEKSVLNPNRGGTLNYRDDGGHLGLPIQTDWLRALASQEGLRFEHSKAVYRPPLLWLLGLKNEVQSVRQDKILHGTWALWGFEQIHWLVKSDA